MSDANEPGAGIKGNGAAAEENGVSAISRDGLRLVSLAMENIGPFDSGEIDFATGGDGAPAVTILTGENGTGKTIVLDAIRGMFGTNYATLERNIWREDAPFRIRLRLAERGFVGALESYKTLGTSALSAHVSERADPVIGIANLPQAVALGEADSPDWTLDYWRSVLATDEFRIRAFQAPEHRRHLLGALQGTYRNQDVTALLCHFDYLRDSRDPHEHASGEAVYQAARRIVSASLLEGGELAHVRRSDLTPMLRQAGQEVPLANISSGNAYLVQHLIELLGKMFSVHMLRKTDPANLCKTPGVLLIDEAENHLHPRWQKRFLRTVLDIFPNLQIVATTHSPFVVSSIPGARVFVCRYEREKKTCTITDETADYANKSVEEILASDVFDGTGPFNEEITKLLEERDRAIDSHDEPGRRRLERELLSRNPLYFRYFEVEERLLAVARGGA